MRRRHGALRELLTADRTVHAVKVAVAAALAWLLVVPWGGVADEYPYYAPLGAVASITGTFSGSLRTTLSNVGAIALGAVPAVLALLLPGPEVAALAVVVLVGAWLAGSDRLGPSTSWIPISGLFILVIGHDDPWTFAGAYLGLVALGALVGLLVDTMWPALPLAGAQRSLDRLRGMLVDQLVDLADGLEADPLPSAADWAERGWPVQRHSHEMQRVLEQVREARQVNWRASRWQETAGRQDRHARALEQLAFLTEDVYRLLARTEQSDLAHDQVALGPGLRPVAARALRATARLLADLTDDAASPDGWRTARDAVEELATEVRRIRSGSDAEFFAAGSLVTALRRTLDSVRPVPPEDAAAGA
ncbi:FUSC family protein [Nocardioides solisilvae]|uniref:FUSC family protein n=1 Tax=Nocardioides solisilvae TaxID=1542435 RepID=UPI000D742808|nr:aromatic acid exporter family protein [Nocardioides solisilvae]